MGTAHTPGPWHLRGARIYDGSPGIDCIATMQVSNQVNWSADAHLMAAAPELLQALQDFSEYAHAKECETDGPVKYSHGEITGLAYAARAAIAKARGQS